MIKIRVLGQLELHDEAGRPLTPVTAASKRMALLSYLALGRAGTTHRRDTLLAMFWPELDQDHGRSALRQELFRIRQGVTDGAMITAGEEVGLDAARFWCDASEFERALDEGREDEALGLYGGDLLTGFHLSGCADFERWLDQERTRLRQRAADAAWTLAEHAEADGATADAARWARQAVGHAPEDEGMVQRLIRLLDRMGDRAGALTEYEALAARLREDFDASPAPETEALIAQVRARVDARDSATPASEPLAQAATEPTAAAVRTRRPFVVTGAIVLAGVIATIGILGTRKRPALDPQRVLVDIFQNDTGDPALDYLGRMTTDRVTAGLTFTGFMDVVSLGAPLLSRSPVEIDVDRTSQGTRLRALGVANRTGTLVWGNYYRTGDSISFHAHITRATTGEELIGLEPTRGHIDDITPAVEQLRDRVMAGLGTVADPRLTRWMRHASKPPTFEAYQEFVRGIETHTTEQRWARSRRFFLNAAAIDTNFTMPLIWALFTVGPRSETDSVLRVLEARRDRMATLDRHLLDYQLSLRAGEPHKALESIRRVVDIAPSSEWLFHAGQNAYGANRPREAVRYFAEAAPDDGWLQGWFQYWDYYTRSLHMLGDLEGELRVARRGRLQYPNRRRWEIRALAALGRIDEMNQLIVEGDEQELRSRALGHRWEAANELRVHGYHREAEGLANRTLAWYEPEPLDFILDRFVHALLLAQAGRFDESRAMLEDDILVEAPRYDLARILLPAVIIRQGHSNDIYEAMGLTEHGDDEPLVRAAIAAGVGDLASSFDWILRSGTNAYEVHRLLPFEPLSTYPPVMEWARPAR